MIRRHMGVIDQRLIARGQGIAGDPQADRAVIDPVRARQETVAGHPPVVIGEDTRRGRKDAQRTRENVTGDARPPQGARYMIRPNQSIDSAAASTANSAAAAANSAVTSLCRCSNTSFDDSDS